MRYAELQITTHFSFLRGASSADELLIDITDVAEHSAGMIGVLVPDEADEICAVQLRNMVELFGDQAYVSLCLRRRPNDRMRLHGIATMAARFRVRTVVTNGGLFHETSRRQPQRVMTCIRTRTTIDDVGFDRERHANRYLKAPEEIHRLFAEYPEALARGREIAERCKFDLKELQYQYPEEAIAPGLDAQQSLVRFTWEGAADRYPEGIPEKVSRSLQHELDLIRTMNYAPHFLTVYRRARLSGACRAT